jgi:toxin ParE1/3/4
MALVWTRSALKSVDDIASYIARDNPARAAPFVAELQASTDRLVSFPGMGKAGRVPGTRELVLHKNYVAIYRVVRTEVQVLRVQHVAQRY